MKYFSTVLALLCCSHAAADTLSITDGAASFTYRSDDAAGTGNADWVLNGADVSVDEAWVLQIGGVGEELLAGSFTSLAPDLGELIFTNAAGTLELAVVYGITDFGGGEMELGFEATLFNLSGATISGDLVNYIDYDLPDVDADAGFLDDFGVGADIIVSADDVFPSGTGFVADRRFEVPDGGELDGPAASDLLTRILAGTTLGRTDNGFIDGDFKAAGGWSFELAAGEEIAFFGDAIAASVPEPSSFLAFGLASLGLLFRRRRVASMTA